MMIPKELTKTQIIPITNGLKVLDSVFNKQSVNYRVLGSVLVAALIGKPHRMLGDIDVLIDEKDYEKIAYELKAAGYIFNNKKKFGFKWLEAEHDGSLGFTFLLIGKFLDEYFSYKLSHDIELRISSEYLKPTRYSLFGISFVGLPPRSIYEGLKISNLNPKRAMDRKIVINSFGRNVPNGATLDKSFKVYFRGIQLPYAYIIFSQLYNFYGGIRVLLGKKYEIWE